MTKLIIQFPCLNEAKDLPKTIDALPRCIPGIDLIEILIVDDGSVDNTAQIARMSGVQDAVRSEPVSVAIFPANDPLAGNFQQLLGMTAHPARHKGRFSAACAGKFPAHAGREFSSPRREGSHPAALRK
ncbi:glycosyltransferase [Sphingobium sp. SJ10-10]|uniref:glycosyltransferase n=1 Tax=Sphingobium sp. SJ10-10 TaxID=3114999 RepID=UPI002E16BDA2|nr:glycosyltransferase [Sphingobium sp. SJ10-10]